MANQIDAGEMTSDGGGTKRRCTSGDGTIRNKEKDDQLGAYRVE